MALIEATPEAYRLKASFKLPSHLDNSWPHPVIANGRLYLRDQDVLMCYDLRRSYEASRVISRGRDDPYPVRRYKQFSATALKPPAFKPTRICLIDTTVPSRVKNSITPLRARLHFDRAPLRLIRTARLSRSSFSTSSFEQGANVAHKCSRVASWWRQFLPNAYDPSGRSLRWARNSTRQRINCFERLSCELLEDRQLLAADLAALLSGIPALHVDRSAYHSSQLLVRFDESVASARDYLQTAADVSLRGALAATAMPVVSGLHKLALGSGVAVESALAALRKDPHVLFAEPDYIVRATGVSTDPLFVNQWDFHNTGQSGGTFDADIDAPEAWDVTTGTGSTIVAVIDTGVDYLHPDLAANIWVNQDELPGNGIDDDGNGYVDDIRGYDFYNNDNNPFDDHGHGTHVAGTIGAVGNNGDRHRGRELERPDHAAEVSWRRRIGHHQRRDRGPSLRSRQRSAHLQQQLGRRSVFAIAVQCDSRCPRRGAHLRGRGRQWQLHWLWD